MFNFDFVEAWRALHTKCSFVNWELKSEYKGKTNRMQEEVVKKVLCTI